MEAYPVIPFAAGLILVASTLAAATRTLVLPRGANVWLTNLVFRALGALFSLRVRAARSYERQDQVMALYAPISLLTLPVVWLSLVLVGYMGMFWALGIRPWGQAFWVSGSSLLTLGFAPVHTLPQITLAFTAATIGLGLVALLIAYLPTMYSAFARRETAVALLEVYAGSPPSAIELISRIYRIRGVETMGELWSSWEVWFAEIEESHTSLAALTFFRSPTPHRSWTNAAGAVLDAAALAVSTLDIPSDPRAHLCIRAGYLALRRIAAFFQIPYDPEPHPNDPISISRQEYLQACDQLAQNDIPLKSDREQAWRDFAGWRVNYDRVLLALASLTMAPTAPWTSDRPPLPWNVSQISPNSPG